MAGPFFTEINDGDHHHITLRGSKNDTHILPVAGSALEGVLGVGPCGGLALAVIDPALFENFSYFLFVDMAAIHAAACMFGIDQLVIASAKTLITSTITVFSVLPFENEQHQEDDGDYN